MLSRHPTFKWPQNSEIKLWRYMDLGKFVWLLMHRSLYFPRADRLGDPFEGSITKATIENRARILRDRHHDPRLADWRQFTDGQITDLFAMNAELNRRSLMECFVSCWHMSEHESAAMWRLYSQSNEAVCIQTTFNHLVEGLPRYVHAGMVNYVDYERDFIPESVVFYPLLHKRRSFEHEHELRAIAWSKLSDDMGGGDIRRNATDMGLFIPIEIERIIESVYISPSSPHWFRELVDWLVKGQGLGMPVRQSSLADTPIY